MVRDSDKAERMVALACRSMAALIRSIALDPRFRKPGWVDKTENAAILAPLVLVGAWSRHEGDLGVLEKLTGKSREEIERLLSSLSSRSDAPFVRSGDTWRLTSPVEAALLLLPMNLGHGNEAASGAMVISSEVIEIPSTTTDGYVPGWTHQLPVSQAQTQP